MWHSVWTIPAVLLLGSLVNLADSARFVISAPKTPHYDSDFMVTVTASGINRPEEIFLSFRGFYDYNHKIHSTTLNFEFDGIQTWTVQFPWKNMEKMGEVGVRLEASSNFDTQDMELRFSQSTGYIFIQTDKPLYSPGQKVKFRVIAVNEDQKLSTYPLKVDIMNSNGIVVDRMRYTAVDAFKGQELQLPCDTKEGNWTITALFEGVNEPSQAKSVNFEVKEYVLPRFSSSVVVDKDVISYDTRWITITVQSKYIYGQPLIGSAELMLGLWDTKEGLTLFPERYSHRLDGEGMWTLDVKLNEVMSRAFIEEDLKRLYVAVNVTEDETLENDTLINTSTFIAHPYYEVTFKHNKAAFKPGFPFTFHSQVQTRSGRKAKWLSVYAIVEIKDKDDKTMNSRAGVHKLNSRGELKLDVLAPEDAYMMNLKFVIIDFKLEEHPEHSISIPRMDSITGEYIYISMTSPVTRYGSGNVTLSYTKPRVQFMGLETAVDKITLLVLSKGHIVYSTSAIRRKKGYTGVSLPNKLYNEISPYMRIVAFYTPNQKDYVVDSLRVETEKVCLDELRLTSRGSQDIIAMNPKEIFELRIRGGSNMMVGLSAVDKAVYLLNNKRSLTRDSIFTAFSQHDQGNENGDGTTFKDIMENSGLKTIILDIAAEPLAQAFAGRMVMHGMQTNAMRAVWRQDVPSARAPKGEDVYLAPPETVRKYFPESWLFEEKTLSGRGRLSLDLTLPDSITTWSFMGVGISKDRGVCVSNDLEQKVDKLFFVEVKAPFKVTRLEEVKVKVAIYNFQIFPINVKVRVTGSEGICFSEEERDKDKKHTEFEVFIGKQSLKSRIVKIIPLRNGDLTLRVDVQHPSDRDVVEKNLHVVAEGLRIRKSVTFVLDPEAKHVTYKGGRKSTITLLKSATLTNLIDRKNKTQISRIDLAMPNETIAGTEFCRIAAFGDLMGDIITHAVIHSKSLMETETGDAEEVLGDLGPTVHALISANKSGLMNEELRIKSQHFVRHEVMRLLKYRQDEGFSLRPEDPAAPWLTAVALKTLCHASTLAFIDRDALIDSDFFWLQNQIQEDGTIFEGDNKLANDSHDYKINLAAEVLIALQECKRYKDDEHVILASKFLEDSVQAITEPMVLAKTAYALTLNDIAAKATQMAVSRLSGMKSRNMQNQLYWSGEDVHNEKRKVPFWYHKGVKSSSIEATAYALLVFLKHPKINVDAIADWLVSQRNFNGAFNGAMDSIIAIQALATYSTQKHGLRVDLSCNVTSDRFKDYSHFFKFTKQNAMTEESLHDVPVGQTLEVFTKGEGLGQMQVNIEYNVPIERNLNCPFNVTVKIVPTRLVTKADMDRSSDPLCPYCNIGCVEEPDINDDNSTDGNSAMSEDDFDSHLNGTDFNSTMPSHNGTDFDVPVGKTEDTHRNRRSVNTGRSICIRVCLKPLKEGDVGATKIEIEMLTGYIPVMSDIERIKKAPNVRQAKYVQEKDVLVVHFTKINENTKTCVDFRAVDVEDVGHPTPSSIAITTSGDREPSCVSEYNPPAGQESLQVFCADFSHKDRGECRCFSGKCSSCETKKLNFVDMKQLVCKADLVYQLMLTKIHERNQWVEINANVISTNLTGIHEPGKHERIKLMTPGFCPCPVKMYSQSEPIYMTSQNAVKLVNRNGKYVYRYLLDERTTFLKIPRMTNDSQALHYSYLQKAVRSRPDCRD